MSQAQAGEGGCPRVRGWRLSRRGKLGARDMGGDTTRGRGMSRRKICKKTGAVSEQKRKGKRLKKKMHLAAASHLAFVSEKAQRAWN